MFHRICKPSLFQSFFLFGARGTGKSTMIRDLFGFPSAVRSGMESQKAVYIDLLDTDEEQLFATRPHVLIERLDSLSPHIEWIIIDEIQKAPKLLNLVHQEIERSNKKFALTGSSARKLKAGGVNLLAGRASVFNLSPLTYNEIGSDFSLEQVLAFGSLPRVVNLKNETERGHVLRSYAQTYLKEEIWGEQLVRKIDSFRKFIEVVAQMNGKILNHAAIARDTATDVKTIHNYFEILEDTLLGIHLEAFDTSFRSRLSRKPKFFIFDLGVARALARTLTVPLLPQTSAFGEAFEHYIILEAMRLHQAHGKDFRFSYLLTKDGLEIDLVVERPGLPLAFIEIKSTDHVQSSMLLSMERIGKSFTGAHLYCLSRERMRRKVGNVDVLPWKEGLNEIFFS